MPTRAEVLDDAFIERVMDRWKSSDTMTLREILRLERAEPEEPTITVMVEIYPNEAYDADDERLLKYAIEHGKYGIKSVKVVE